MDAAPLSDIVVVDVTVAYAGPLASLLLAGLGARVVKVEAPGRGDLTRTSPPYLGRDGVRLVGEDDDVALPHINRSRGKLGVTLDLKHPLGVEVMHDLARVADVVVDNNSSGALDALGVGYEQLSAVNPRLVYCSLTGFGSAARGPDRRAFDLIVQALSGVMAVTGEPGGPPVRQGLVFGDILAPLLAVGGVLAALHERGRSGRGQHVDVAMLDALTAFVAAEHFDALGACGVPSRTGNSLVRMAPFGAYRSRDGHVALCAPSDAQMRSLAQAMGREELLEDPRFASRAARTAHCDELDAEIEAWTSELAAGEVVDRLTAVGVPAAEVRDPEVATRDPRVLERGAVVPLRHPRHGATADVMGMGMPIRFSRSPAGLDGRDAPFLGEHNESVYRELLGYDEARLRRLADEGVI